MKRLTSTAVALALAGCATTQQAASPTTADTIAPARLAEHIRVLASDEFQGRGPATAGEEQTVAYIAEQFRAAGLEPGGPDGSWFQEVPLHQYDIVGQPELSLTVAKRRQALTQGEQVAVRASMRNVDRVDIADAPLVFLGYGIKAPERNWDDFEGQDLRGKVGIVLVNDPDFETAPGDFGGKAMTYYGRWTYKYEEAARQGLAGLLIVHETAPASYGWATVKNSNTNTMFDIVRSNPAEVHPLLEGWLQRDVAVELLRAAGHDFEALKRQAQSREFRPVPLGDARFSAAFAVKRETIRSKNVLGRLRGSTRSEETVLYGGHWDHLGVGAPDAQGDRIYNGAVDNATGVAALIEIARAFARGTRPERSVVFAAWTVEEKGLLGSEYYAANPVYPLQTTAAGFNIDALEPHGPARDVLVIGYGQSELEGRLERLLAAGGRVVARDAHPEAGYFFRSDHFPMAKRGVPMLYVDSGMDLLSGGTAAAEAASAAYRKDRYHQPADEFDAATWNLEGMAQDATVLYRLGLELASSRDWPNYHPGSEFRPVRDASASSRQ
ncbi:MAG: M28 family metallopeptidase [Myxococcaceae bacterium]|nr:M28 family metallopeptidase [Myxococcaceae bacterium]MCI0672217.1 M28 family metallopeptidase [Myxococcaceae bacterium]